MEKESGMNEKGKEGPGLDFSLPGRRSEQKSSGTLITLLAVVLLVSLAGAGLQLMDRFGRVEPAARGLEGLSTDELKDLALRLEQRDLAGPAVEVWETYLAASDLDREGRGKIYYRIGKLRFAQRNWEQALASFYRAEALSKDEALADEIGKRVQECFEHLGSYTAMKYDLAERTGLERPKEAAGSDVLAEIGSRRITERDLDTLIETQIDQQLETFGAALEPEAREAQKKEMMKQFQAPQARQSVLQSLIAEEVLSRESKALGIDQDEAVRAMLGDIERKLLAQQLMTRRFADEIKLTNLDLETYYEVYKSDYRTPERARISHILVEGKEKEREVRALLDGGQAFADVAKAHSMDEATRDKGGEIADWVERGGWVPHIGPDEGSSDVIFTTPAGQIAPRSVESDRGRHIIFVHERESENQKSLQEASQEVYRDLRERKEREIQEKLFLELREKYDVVIHASRLAGAGREGEGVPEGAAPKDDVGATGRSPIP